jgi:hypothetical protein
VRRDLVGERDLVGVGLEVDARGESCGVEDRDRFLGGQRFGGEHARRDRVERVGVDLHDRSYPCDR